MPAMLPATPSSGKGHSVLQVPVPELEPFVLDRTRHYDTDYVSADPGFVHAHVTALAPFLDAPLLTSRVLARVAEIACATAPFDFTLDQVDTFPNGIVHLLPEPATPFATLTATLWDAFPQCPPYAGRFGDVVPHLTLDALCDDVTQESTRSLVAPHLPARCRAERVDLAWYEPGACRILHSWPLGGA
ncbi:2'-5' RNA ligase family protein [Terrabacter sp. C0L_2]|uniref:2'-5' RNA ligase family protein n=1 Tax=Terrabacter sp. C0L_2 TaxID=3108389 RepID=UPI002ED6282A|nr:2'-5' RNA ligase family protein [Terrabacter sp. C0L_2]